MAPIKFKYDPGQLPRNFDARQKWPTVSGQIADQGWCGASWAFSTASVASDRFAIGKYFRFYLTEIGHNLSGFLFRIQRTNGIELVPKGIDCL